MVCVMALHGRFLLLFFFGYTACEEYFNDYCSVLFNYFKFPGVIIFWTGRQLIISFTVCHSYPL